MPNGQLDAGDAVHGNIGPTMEGDLSVNAFDFLVIEGHRSIVGWMLV